MSKKLKCPCCGRKIDAGKMTQKEAAAAMLSLLGKRTTRLDQRTKNADPAVEEQIRRNVETFIVGLRGYSKE